MNETLDKTAGKLLETEGSVPVGVLLLILLALIGLLAFALYKQHQWMVKKDEKSAAAPAYDDSRMVEVLADVREGVCGLHTEIAVGFKSLEKILETFIQIQRK